LSPELQLHASGGVECIYGSTFPSGSTNLPPLPDALTEEILSVKKLVYYDWEITGQRIGGWLYFGQALRVMLHKPQLPHRSGSVAWMAAAASKLGNCVTEVTQMEPRHLSLVRKSGVGLNSIELHLLADWFESPDFPRGLNTLLGTNVVRAARGNPPDFEPPRRNPPNPVSMP
jgi:hypothetical protein